MNDNPDIFSLAENGDADSQFSLGLKHYDGKDVPKDLEKAIFWFTKAAEQGHAQAQYELGRCYSKGEGITQDYPQAFEWYRKAGEGNRGTPKRSLILVFAMRKVKESRKIISKPLNGTTRLRNKVTPMHSLILLFAMIMVKE